MNPISLATSIFQAVVPDERRKMGIVTGAIQAMAGAILQGIPRWGLPGSLLLNAGLNGTLYSSSTEEEKFEFTTFCKSEARGVASSLLSYGIFFLNPGGLLVGKAAAWAVRLFNSTIAHATLTTTHSILKGEQLELKKILKSTIAAAGGASAESLLSYWSPIPQSAPQRMLYALCSTLVHTSSQTLIENYLELKRWNKNLLQSCSISALLGSVTAASIEFHSSPEVTETFFFEEIDLETSAAMPEASFPLPSKISPDEFDFFKRTPTARRSENPFFENLGDLTNLSRSPRPQDPQFFSPPYLENLNPFPTMRPYHYLTQSLENIVRWPFVSDTNPTVITNRSSQDIENLIRSLSELDYPMFHLGSRLGSLSTVYPTHQQDFGVFMRRSSISDVGSSDLSQQLVVSPHHGPSSSVLTMVSSTQSFPVFNPHLNQGWILLPHDSRDFGNLSRLLSIYTNSTVSTNRTQEKIANLIRLTKSLSEPDYPVFDLESELGPLSTVLNPLPRRNLPPQDLERRPENLINGFLENGVGISDPQPPRAPVEKFPPVIDINATRFQSLKQQLSRIKIHIPPFQFSYTLHPVRAAELPPLFFSSQAPVVEFVDVEEWNELIQHLVLVHGIGPNSIAGLLDRMATDEERATYLSSEPSYQTLYRLQNVLSSKGELGTHLDFIQNQFKDQKLVDRPHLHWACGQLCQPNSGGGEDGWEKCDIVILEPLAAFEGEISSLYGIAPYDTFTIGKHLLSSKSTILIPNHTEQNARAHLADYLGRGGTIVGYPIDDRITTRVRVFQTLQTQYPQIWHLVDPETGGKIAPINHQNSPSYHFGGGYFEKTCLERGDGKRVILITRSGGSDDEIHAKAIKDAKAKGKFIGLHANSITCWLEDSTNSSFENLKKFKKDLSFAKEKPCFLGYAQESAIDQLVILEAFRFRVATQEIKEENQIKNVGDYVLNEALYADLLSLFYAKGSDQVPAFAPFEIELMLFTYKEELLKCVETLFNNKTPEALQKYRTSLNLRLESFLKAKAELERAETGELVESALLKEIRVTEAWQAIQAKQLNFDVRWPLHAQERAFFDELQNVCRHLKTKKLKLELRNLQDSPTQLTDYLKYGLRLVLQQRLFLKELPKPVATH